MTTKIKHRFSVESGPGSHFGSVPKEVLAKALEPTGLDEYDQIVLLRKYQQKIPFNIVLPEDTHVYGYRIENHTHTSEHLALELRWKYVPHEEPYEQINCKIIYDHFDDNKIHIVKTAKRIQSIEQIVRDVYAKGVYKKKQR